MESKLEKEKKDDKKCRNPKHPEKITTNTKMDIPLSGTQNKQS
ncbi:hypothetical protein [Clostridium akagii]|nr:hypothetical protein [Clostridium akagii]